MQLVGSQTVGLLVGEGLPAMLVEQLVIVVARQLGQRLTVAVGIYCSPALGQVYIHIYIYIV